jgi:transposase
VTDWDSDKTQINFCIEQTGPTDHYFDHTRSPFGAAMRVVGAIEGGATIPEAAEQYGVSISSVVRFLKLHRETGSVGSAKFGGYKDFALAAHEDLVRQLVAEQPDITLAELEDRLTKKKITVGKSSISRFLHHLKLPFKKKSAGSRAGSPGRGRRP